MSNVDELQGKFSEALAEIAGVTPPLVSTLHGRLRRRRMRLRVAGLAGLAMVAVISVGVGFPGAQPRPAGAVTLRATGSDLSHHQLLADATIMRHRLGTFGSSHAHVAVSGNTIVVTGGPSQLADPTSALIASPELLVRPVLCVSGPYEQSASTSGNTLPSSCAGTPYAIQMATPTSGGGYTGASPQNDPALAGIPTTSPSQDAANPHGVAVLPVADASGAQLPPGITIGERYLVGPTQLTLSSKVASAVVGQNSLGNWVVDVQLSSGASAAWDAVAHNYFHLLLGVDLNGQIVSAPLIEPTETAYTSFDGKMQLSGFTSQASAQAVAAALQSGPLATPLRVG